MFVSKNFLYYFHFHSHRRNHFHLSWCSKGCEYTPFEFFLGHVFLPPHTVAQSLVFFHCCLLAEACLFLLFAFFLPAFLTSLQGCSVMSSLVAKDPSLFLSSVSNKGTYHSLRILFFPIRLISFTCRNLLH